MKGAEPEFGTSVSMKLTEWSWISYSQSQPDLVHWVFMGIKWEEWEPNKESLLSSRETEYLLNKYLHFFLLLFFLLLFEIRTSLEINGWREKKELSSERVPSSSKYSHRQSNWGGYLWLEDAGEHCYWYYAVWYPLHSLSCLLVEDAVSLLVLEFN